MKITRIAAVDACRWSTKSIPAAPYVTSLPWISHYGCHYVAHGDDITSDSNGEDCYRYVKAAGRFVVVKRTPSISTTDLVGRMLLCTKNHFIRSLSDVLEGVEGPGAVQERQSAGLGMKKRIEEYASDQTGTQPGCTVFAWISSPSTGDGIAEDGRPQKLIEGNEPQSGQRIVYVDGGFDLFSSGHIEFLRQVSLEEAEIGRQHGRYTSSEQLYSPAYIIAGVHDDTVINRWKGLNYPIMNIFERGLCVLQCRVSLKLVSLMCSSYPWQYINSVVFSAPFAPSATYLSSLPYGMPHAVYHGPTSFVPLIYDPYSDARKLRIYRQIGEHSFQNVNAGEIVQRILKSRQRYEARQMAKGEKGLLEKSILHQGAALANV